jgi:hypothetical protein
MAHHCLWHSGLVSSTAYALDLIIAVVTVVGGSALGWRVVGASRHLLTPYRAGVVAKLGGWWSLRRFARMLPARDAEGLQDGHLVRLTGVVESREARPAELSGIDATVCKHAFGESGGGAAGKGLWACDFSLRLGDGTVIRVLAGAAWQRRRLTCIDRSPHRWKSGRPPDGWLYESRIAPGDEIEVAGILRRQVDPSVARASDRSPALGWTMGGQGGRLLLRFATRADAERRLSPFAAAMQAVS